MKLEQRGFLGTDTASIEIPEGQITILAGLNGAGKSSLLTGLRCVVDMDNKPLGFTKSEAMELVHEGMTEGEVVLTSKTGTRKLSLPGLEIKTISGSGINASKTALQIVRVGELTTEERSKLLQSVLKTQSTKAKLKEELERIAHLPDADLTSCLTNCFGTDRLEPKGWDAAAKSLESAATVKKGEFKATTGFVWGKNQGETFKPAGWADDLSEVALSSLNVERVKARENLEKAIAANAIGEQEYLKLETHAAKVPNLINGLEASQATVKQFQLKYDELMAKMSESKTQAVECESCNAVGYVENGKLIKCDSGFMTKEEVAAMVKEIEKAQAALNTAKLAVTSAEGALKAAQESARCVKEWTKVEESPIDAARNLLDIAEQRYKAKETRQKGQEIHRQVIALLEAAELVGPEGLRKRLLIAGIETFNADLAKLTEIAGLPTISINNKLAVTWKGRQYRLISRGEQWITDAVLAIALQKYDDSQIMIFDEASIMDRGHRNGFFKLLRSLKVTTVVGMMAFVAKDGTREVPNLAAMKTPCGITYWVENGHVQRLDEVAKEAA